jgi:hypothetical protein
MRRSFLEAIACLLHFDFLFKLSQGHALAELGTHTHTHKRQGRGEGGGVRVGARAGNACSFRKGLLSRLQPENIPTRRTLLRREYYWHVVATGARCFVPSRLPATRETERERGVCVCVCLCVCVCVCMCPHAATTYEVSTNYRTTYIKTMTHAAYARQTSAMTGACGIR